MRVDVANVLEMANALEHYATTVADQEPLVLVIHTPGGVLYRFICNHHGIERQECTKTGEAL